MHTDITKQLEMILQEDERLLGIAQKRLTRCAEGKLRVRKRKGNHYFSRELQMKEVPKRKESYIRKDNTRLLTSLGNRIYCELLIPALKSEIQTIRQFLEQYDPACKTAAFTSLPTEIQSPINPLALTDEQVCANWEHAPYDRSSYPMPAGAYKTKRGEYVRSRAEYIIANMLYDLHIPYRYECAFYLADGSVVYPDFTIMHPVTHELYYIEFFGKMDEEEYAAINFNKIRNYAMTKEFPRFLLIFDHRDAPFNTDMLLEILRNTFLDGKEVSLG
jgi:hypothetical protein